MPHDRHAELDSSLLEEFIGRNWITPENLELDEEDLARAGLILELRRDFGVNDEGISIILYLLDELYAIRARLERLAGYSARSQAR